MQKRAHVDESRNSTVHPNMDARRERSVFCFSGNFGSELRIIIAYSKEVLEVLMCPALLARAARQRNHFGVFLGVTTST